MAIPDPPKNIRLAAFLENSVNLSGLEVAFDPSQGEYPLYFIESMCVCVLIMPSFSAR